MTLIDVWIMLGFSVFFYVFWQHRRSAEIAKVFFEDYCKKNQLQALSISKVKQNLTIGRRTPIIWCLVYQVEFSSDGDNQYQGFLTIEGNKVKSIELPTYRLS